MTITFAEGDIGQQVDLLAFTEEQFTEAAQALAQALTAVRGGRLDEAKAALGAVRDLKAAFHLVQEERARVEKLRRQAAGIVHGYAIDMDAARDEVGRRLARLRDAGGD
jgi:soluble cytochrome b562